MQRFLFYIYFLVFDLLVKTLFGFGGKIQIVSIRRRAVLYPWYVLFVQMHFHNKAKSEWEFIIAEIKTQPFYEFITQSIAINKLWRLIMIQL